MRPMIALLAVLALPAHAVPLPIEVVDGDTIMVAQPPARVRLVGIDTPELRGKCEAETVRARLARTRLREIVAAGVTVHYQTRRDGSVALDRYGRPLAILRNAAGQDVASTLISEGLARPYDGRSRRLGWC